MIVQHFVPVSGGKDSAGVACLAVERAQRDPAFKPRFQFSDTFNEDPRTIEHLDHIERQLGIVIERVSAYNVPGLIDAAAFERKRASIRENWAKELRRKRHKEGCDKSACDCPVVVSPPVSPERIEQAIAALQPTGNAFLDMCLLHGRFPSKKAKFCTDELKLRALHLTKAPIWAEGGLTIDWVVDWTRTGRGGRQFDLLQAIEQAQMDEDGAYCDSEYGLCE